LTDNIVRNDNLDNLGVLKAWKKHIVHIYVAIQLIVRSDIFMKKMLVIYRSPFKRSPTANGRFISCLAQSTAPTPVAARPLADRSALTALWFEHVLD
jgi:hypothetical protein